MYYYNNYYYYININQNDKFLLTVPFANQLHGKNKTKISLEVPTGNAERQDWYQQV